MSKENNYIYACAFQCYFMQRVQQTRITNINGKVVSNVGKCHNIILYLKKKKQKKSVLIITTKIMSAHDKFWRAEKSNSCAKAER